VRGWRGRGIESACPFIDAAAGHAWRARRGKAAAVLQPCSARTRGSGVAFRAGSGPWQAGRSVAHGDSWADLVEGFGAGVIRVGHVHVGNVGFYLLLFFSMDSILLLWRSAFNEPSFEARIASLRYHMCLRFRPRKRSTNKEALINCNFMFGPFVFVTLRAGK